MSERYSFSLTTFSPSGKLFQIEYALSAVASGAPAVGIKAINGTVIVTENKTKSILVDETSIQKVVEISEDIGMVYSGMNPDFHVLVRRARKLAQQYRRVYGQPMPVGQLVQRVAAIMQEYTQSGGVRPFGVSLLLIGWDTPTNAAAATATHHADPHHPQGQRRPRLYQCDPSGAYFAWRATAMGKNFVNGRTFLEKRYSDDIELEDAVHMAILTLKESFEGQMDEHNIAVGVCDADGFRRLKPAEIKDYLDTLV